MRSCVLIILTSGMWYCNCRLVLDETDLRIKAQSSLFYLENRKWFPFKFREPAVFLQFSYKMQFLSLLISLLKKTLIFYKPSAQVHPKKRESMLPEALWFYHVRELLRGGGGSCDWRKRQPSTYGCAIWLTPLHLVRREVRNLGKSWVECASCHNTIFKRWHFGMMPLPMAWHGYIAWLSSPLATADARLCFSVRAVGRNCQELTLSAPANVFVVFSWVFRIVACRVRLVDSPAIACKRAVLFLSSHTQPL